MSKFKVGDRVRRVCTENRGGDTFSEWVLPVGSTATVESIKHDKDDLEAITIREIVGQIGYGAEETSHLSRYFELVQEPAKQAAKAGGLQEHSLGDCYPYAVVGYGNGGETTFVVENLQTGEVAVDSDGGLCMGDAGNACRMQTNISKGKWRGGWSKERPCYYAGSLSLPGEPSGSYATALTGQETVLGRKLTPREQYQLVMEIGK